MLRQVVVAVLVLTSTVLGACADKSMPPEGMPSQLRAIHKAMEKTIAKANSDTKITWHSGWTGNIAVNATETDRGLCFHWRDLVWEGVYPTIKQQGWDATGITISYGTLFEHHSVLVWDPKVVSREQLLIRQRDVYVLDGWRRGMADVLRLDDWIDDQFTVVDGPKIRELSPPGLPGSKPTSSPLPPAFPADRASPQSPASRVAPAHPGNQPVGVR
ncbi:MAG: hypothetical protein ACREJO_07965 [Phycisphaerales bacterium]